LLDVRVRRAVAQSFDTPGVIDGLTGGRGLLTYTMSSPRAPYYPVIERAITKNEYDPRASARLFEEAGLARAADGFYRSASGEPFQLDVWTTGGSFSQENRVWVDGLRRNGIEATPQTLGPALLADAQARALTPGMFTAGAGAAAERYRDLSIKSIPKADNRWTGNNRGGWESPDYERFYQAYNTALDRDNRIQQLAQMEKTVSADVGSIPHYFTLVITAFSSDLVGPAMRQTPDAANGQSNVFTWEWKN
jgi:ABC-type transport system substrate-binding protein